MKLYIFTDDFWAIATDLEQAKKVILEQVFFNEKIKTKLDNTKVKTIELNKPYAHIVWTVLRPPVNVLQNTDKSL